MPATETKRRPIKINEGKPAEEITQRSSNRAILNGSSFTCFDKLIGFMRNYKKKFPRMYKELLMILKLNDIDVFFYHYPKIKNKNYLKNKLKEIVPSLDKKCEELDQKFGPKLGQLLKENKKTTNVFINSILELLKCYKNVEIR